MGKHNSFGALRFGALVLGRPLGGMDCSDQHSGVHGEFPKLGSHCGTPKY